MGLGLLDRFRRQKVEEKTEEKAEEKTEDKTELYKFLENDPEVYVALSNTMFLDPRKVDVSMSEAAKKAKKLEDDKDLVRARVWYEIAGGLAIHKGDVEKVKEFFSRSQKISPDIEYPILRNTSAAVAKAQDYYKKHLGD